MLLQLTKSVNKAMLNNFENSFEKDVPSYLQALKKSDVQGESTWIHFHKKAKPVKTVSRTAYYQICMDEEYEEQMSKIEGYQTIFDVSKSHIANVFKEMLKMNLNTKVCRANSFFEYQEVDDDKYDTRYSKRSFGAGRRDVYVPESKESEHFIEMVCSIDQEAQPTAFITRVGVLSKPGSDELQDFGSSIVSVLNRLDLGLSDVGIEVWVDPIRRIQIAFSNQQEIRSRQIAAIVKMLVLKLTYDELDDTCYVEFHMPIIHGLLSQPENSGEFGDPFYDV